MINLDYLYNPAAAKKAFERNYFVDKKLGFSVIENGTILPHKRLPTAKELKRRIWGAGGIADSKGEFVKSSSVVDGTGEIYTLSPAESICHSSETVIYLGLFFPVWGHVLTDNIRRLWFLNSDIFNSEFKNCSLVYIPWTASPIEEQQNFKRLLEILGLDVERLQPINQPTQFDKIILPQESFFPNKSFTNEYLESIDRIRDFAIKNRTPTSSKKIYYFYGRKQFGEERLAEYLKSKGYDVVRPEKLTLDEQLNLMINCESFASTLGSISHNSVFLRDDTECIFIPRFSNAFNAYQQAINQVHPINVSYVDSSMSLFSIVHDLSCFIISKQLKNFFGDKFNGYDEEDFRAFLDYVKFSMINKKRAANPMHVAGYGTAFTDFWEELRRHKDLIAAYNMPPHWEELRPLLTYRTHVHKDGWCSWQNEEQISNPLNKKCDIQAIKINFSTHKVYYSVYYNDAEGWSEEVAAPETVGTIGKRKSIYGMRIRFDEAGAKEFDILYRVHKFDNTWTHWAKNGEALYSHGVKLNAIQIKLESKPIPAKKTEVMPQP